MHLLFAFAIVTEEKNHWGISMLGSSLFLGVSIGYLYLFQQQKAQNIASFLVVPATVFGGLAAFWLNHDWQLGPVLGSALIGSIGAFAPKKIKGISLGNSLRTAIFCGSFIGMTQLQVIDGNAYCFVSFAALISGLFLWLAPNCLQGFGGKLGSMAFAGVALLVFMTFLWNY